MSTGYTRNDTTNNIANGNIVDASDLDGEFDAIQAAFDVTTGHTHDDTVGGGSPITVVGPAQDVVVTIAAIRPKTDNTVDLGTSTLEYKDLYIDGVANIDSLVADTADINAGTIDNATIATSNITVGSGKTLDVSAGTLTLADNQISGDKVEGGTINATTITTLTSTTGNITSVNATTVDTTNLEVTNLKAKDGTSAGSIADTTGIVTLASSVLTTTDINGGTIDGTVIGVTSAAAGTFTTANATTLSIGGTAITATAAELNILDGVTATAAELNILDGVTATAAELNILDGITANTAQLNSSSEDVNAENRIINGDFGIWQRGTTTSTSNTLAADRWRHIFVGGAATNTRVATVVGATLGGQSALAVMRCSVSGQTLQSQYALLQHRIEGVNSYNGQTITILGYAQRSSGASGNMTVSLAQDFGTGGSPSAQLFTGETVVTLTGTFAPFAVTLTVPSIVGKTLGTNGNDYLALNFWYSQGTDFGGLGLQTIGVDLWGIHIRTGTWTAADAALYRPRDPGTELALCRRYYNSGILIYSVAYQTIGNGFSHTVSLGIPMRTIPTVGIESNSSSNLGTFITGAVTGQVYAQGVALATGAVQLNTFLSADAEL